LGREYAFLSRTRKLLKFAHYQKLPHRFQANTMIKPLNTLRGWSKHAYNKSKTADGCHLKTQKSPYLSNGLGDRQEIWHGDDIAAINFTMVSAHRLQSLLPLAKNMQKKTKLASISHRYKSRNFKTVHNEKLYANFKHRSF